MESITKRIDSITYIDSNRLSIAPPAPRSVKIELVENCNFRCSFCALQDRVNPCNDSMDLEFFKKITTQMKKAGVEEIGLFFIGESTLNPSLLIAANRFLKKELKMPYVFLTTNGSAANTTLLKTLMEDGLDSLKWSINSYDPEQFSKIAGTHKRFFNVILENLKNAWELRQEHQYKTRLSASSIMYNGEQQGKMEAMLETFVKPYVDTHYWLPLYNSSDFAAQRQTDLGYKVTAGNQGRIGALRDPLPCWSMFTEGHVRVDGTMSACCFDALGNFTVGDLHKNTFMECWHSSIFQLWRSHHLRKDVKGTPCENCIAYS